jgi:hypothetical protein
LRPLGSIFWEQERPFARLFVSRIGKYTCIDVYRRKPNTGGGTYVVYQVKSVTNFFHTHYLVCGHGRSYAFIRRTKRKCSAVDIFTTASRGLCCPGSGNANRARCHKIQCHTGELRCSREQHREHICVDIYGREFGGRQSGRSDSHHSGWVHTSDGTRYRHARNMRRDAGVDLRPDDNHRRGPAEWMQHKFAVYYHLL